jgi:type II secretory pathway component PulF
LHRIVLSWQPQLAAGRTPADLVNESRRFPEMFSNFYASGEISGKLDDSLRKLRQYYLEEGERKLQTLANLTPKVVYLIILICIAFAIIKFYLGIYGPGSDLDKAIKGFRD